MKIFIILFLFVSSVWAESFIGEVKLVKGTVLKSAKGMMKPVKVGTQIFINDILKTEEKSFVKIIMTDDSQINLGPRSELDFEDYQFVDKSNRSAVFNFIKGQLTGHVVNKAREGAIKFKTRVATMGIRGTEILINHKSSLTREISEFALLSGNAQVTDNKNQNYELAPKDRVIMVDDNQTGAVQRIKDILSEEDFNTLKAVKVKEEEEFKPFMPYFDLTKAGKEATPTTQAANTVAPQGAQSAQDATANAADDSSGEAPKKNWRENLDELNQQLKDSQKRK